jgi:HEAT repeat protein
MLGKLHDARAVPPLIALMQSNVNALVRITTAQTLARFDDPRVFPALVRSLSDDQEGVRGSAALALGRTRKPAVLDLLLPLLRSGSSYLRERAAEGLGELGDRRASGPLMDVLNNPATPPRLALECQSALEKLGR